MHYFERLKNKPKFNLMFEFKEEVETENFY